MKQNLKEFLQIVDDIYGLYLDAVVAFWTWFEKLQNIQINISTKQNMSIEELDKRPFFYSKNDNYKHVRTQAEIKKRNITGGKNHKSMANLCLVLIYQYWEFYRIKIENDHGLEKNSLKSDLMADIRYLRNSILKHKGKGNHEMKKCKILKWFKENQEINFDDKQFEKII